MDRVRTKPYPFTVHDIENIFYVASVLAKNGNFVGYLLIATLYCAARP